MGKDEKLTFSDKAKYGMGIGMTRGADIGEDLLKDAYQKTLLWKIKLKKWFQKLRS